MTRLQAVCFLVVAVGSVGYFSRQQPIYAAGRAAVAGRVAVTAYSAAAPVGMQAGAPSSATGAGQGADSVGAKSYASHCAMCHGAQREGMAPVIPSLVGVSRRLTDEQILGIVHNGRGKMPAQPALPPEEVTAIVQFLKADDPAGAKAATSSTSDAKPGPTNANSSIETNTSNGASTNGTKPAVSDAKTSSGDAKLTSGEAKLVHASALTGAGHSIFQQNCAFCHGRDAGGGEAGPDLTRSKLVAADVKGDKISDVVWNGRIEKKMPAFKFSNSEMADLVEYIHAQAAEAKMQKPGGRKGVDVADLQTGNVEAGKRYFNGAGGCAKCHSATGDLAGVASRYEGLQLEERMLYPRDVKSKVAVTLPSGEKIDGTLAYQDEFTVGLKDSTGVYRSWNVGDIKYAIDSPVDAHVEQFPKYTDENIHDLMAYIQTMK